MNGREHNATKIRIVHVINSFQFGGAEAMLCNLVLRTDRDRFEPSVVALIDDMTVAGPLIKAGIPITVIGMKPGLPDPRGVWRLARHLRAARPAVVQTWMDHSNLIGGIASRMGCDAHVVWGVHHSEHVRGVAKRSTLLTVSACAKLSRRVPSQIVLCSNYSRTHYAERGFAAEKLTVIPNGFDTSLFRPDADARRNVRQELGLRDDEVVFGLAARYDPMKDPGNFLQAAALLAKRHASARFVVYGANMNRDNAELMEQIDALGLVDRIVLLGPRRDVARVHAAMDVAVLSSISEAFPLVLGEAMSCGVPCVSTDVGDASLIVGDFGRIVPRRDPQAMADAWGDMIAMGATGRAQLGQQGRQRVRELFDLDAVTRRYEDLYLKLATGGSSPKPASVSEWRTTAAGGAPAPLTGNA
ncbi:MAG TPA: glycosyltransferase [Tepidisphaeraceae bacterium]|jgi:glycosyltransferase involved in cell wall biosynthesis|nr:glycosyltransferase [Tepidisphaeraceae bacterium]